MNLAKLWVDRGVVQLPPSRSWLLCTLIIVLVILIVFCRRWGLSFKLRAEHDSIGD